MQWGLRLPTSRSLGRTSVGNDGAVALGEALMHNSSLAMLQYVAKQGKRWDRGMCTRGLTRSGAQNLAQLYRARRGSCTE